MNSPKLETIRNQVIIFSILIMAFTVFGFLSQFYFLFDIMSQFRLQYVIFGCIFLIVLILFNKYIKTPKWSIVICILIIMINFIQVLPWIKLSKPNEIINKNTTKIMLMNVLTSNNGYNAVFKNVDKFQPNVIFLEEVNAEWLKNMSNLDKTYPYSIKISREDNFGAVLYSKTPFINFDIKLFGRFELPVIVCEIESNKKKVKIIGIHTTPPGTQNYFLNRNEMLFELADLVKNDKNPTVVIGDLNTTMYSNSYKKFIGKSGLINARKNYGIYPSWSPKSKILGFVYDNVFKIMTIPIDQVLHNSKIKVNSFKIGSPIGSDHLPVIVSFE